MNDDLRRDVNIMCNLGEGIEERAIKETTERVTKKVTEEVTREVTEEMTEQFIRSMYDKGCSIELIADVARKKYNKDVLIRSWVRRPLCFRWAFL